jgi:hypothetical protein
MGVSWASITLISISIISTGHHLLGLASALPPHRPLTQQDFVQLLLLHIPHPPEETLYLALSLHSLFQAVLERTATASLTIDFSDFTTYLC